jgi:hypothetical protein
MDINWLPGGPYCEVSLISLNEFNTELELTNCLEKLKSTNYNIDIFENNIQNKIELYCNKTYDQIELNILVNIITQQHSKIYIERLSYEIVEIDFCFLDDNLNNNQRKELKKFLYDLIVLFNGIVGMIGCETDCGLLFFDTNETYPHKDYSMKRIKHYTNVDIENDKEWFNGVEEIIWRNE